MESSSYGIPQTPITALESTAEAPVTTSSYNNENVQENVSKRDFTIKRKFLIYFLIFFLIILTIAFCFYLFNSNNSKFVETTTKKFEMTTIKTSKKINFEYLWEFIYKILSIKF